MWVIFALLDPDPDSEYGSGSETLFVTGLLVVVQCYVQMSLFHCILTILFGIVFGVLASFKCGRYRYPILYHQLPPNIAV